MLANEQAGTRPCIVVSSDRFNQLPIGHCIVVPLTSRNRRLPHHIAVIDDGGLTRPSWAMCEAIRSLSVRWFSSLIGSADTSTTDAVIRQVSRWIEPDGRP
jgi:mRNA interferase MazF